MRTRTADEQTALLAAHAKTYRRLEIKNALGAWEDFTSTFVSRSGGTTVEQSVIDMRFELRRSITGSADSLSPFTTDALDAGRAIRYYSTTLPVTAAAPAPEDLHLVFNGEIDRVSAAADPVVLECRDSIGALLADRWIKGYTDDTVEADGMELEEVAQLLLDDWADGLVLWVPTPTGVTLDADVKIEKGKLLDELRTLAGRIGWTIRPMWNETAGEFQLAFYEPPRDKATVDFTYSKSRYLPLRKLDVDRGDIFNQMRLSYLNAATGLRATLEDEDAASVARFGERWLDFEEADDSPINSSARATAFLDAALSDLSMPDADAEIEVFYNWAVDIDDRYTFGALAKYFSSDQTLAVVGYKQEESRDRERTILTLRGKPTGMVHRWHMPLRAKRYTPEITGLDVTYSHVAGHLLATVIASENTTDIYLTAAIGSDPADPTSASPLHITGSSGTIDTGLPALLGDIGVVKAIARNAFGDYSAVRRSEAARTDGWTAPSVGAEQSLDGFTVRGTDPELRVTAIEFQLRTSGAGAFGAWVSTWDAATGTIGTNTSLIRTEGITRLAGFNVAANWRATYLDPDGNTHTFEGSITFEQLSAARITGAVVTFNAAGEPIVHLEGNVYTTDMYFTMAIETDPGTPDALDFHISGASGTVAVTGSTAAAEGQELWLRAVARDAASVLGVVTGIIKVMRETSIKRPTLSMEVAQVGDTGTVTLSVYDLDLIADEPYYSVKIGAAAWLTGQTTWDSSTGTAGVDTTLIRTLSVLIDPAHNSSVNCFVADDLDGSVPQQRSHTFDIDSIAEITSCVIDFDPITTEVIVEPRGDEDCADLYLLVGDGSDPGTPDSGDTHIAGRAGRIATGVFVDAGDTAFVNVVAQNDALEYGPVAEFQKINGASDGGGTVVSEVRTAHLEVAGFVVSGSPLKLRISWAYTAVLAAGDDITAVMLEYYEDSDTATEFVLATGSTSLSNSGDHDTAYFKDVPGIGVSFTLIVRIYNALDVLQTDRTSLTARVADLGGLA